VLARNWDFVVFVGLVALGAAWLWLHVLLLTRVLSTKSLGAPLKFLALVPVITPFVGFRAGKLWLTGLWFVFAAAYLMLRTVL
jgi:hypothetical protein